MEWCISLQPLVWGGVLGRAEPSEGTLLFLCSCVAFIGEGQGHRAGWGVCMVPVGPGLVLSLSPEQGWDQGLWCLRWGHFRAGPAPGSFGRVTCPWVPHGVALQGSTGEPGSQDRVPWPSLGKTWPAPRKRRRGDRQAESPKLGSQRAVHRSRARGLSQGLPGATSTSSLYLLPPPPQRCSPAIAEGLTERAGHPGQE